MTRLTLVADGAPADLPELPPKQARIVLDRFSAQVGELAQANGANRAWWYSWLSSRDQYHCSLAADLSWLARFDLWLAAPGPVLSIPDPILAAAATKRAQAAGFQVCRPLSARLVWARRRLKSWVEPVLDGAKALSVGLLSWAAARRHPSAHRSGNDVILLAWLDKRLVGAPSPYSHVYFGTLAAMLEQQGERCLHMGAVMAPPSAIGAITQAAAQRNDARMATMGHFLTLADVIASVAGALTERVVMPDDAVLAKALFRRVVYSAQSRMIERATARALALNPRARIIRIYENLPWERAVDVAARAAGRDVTGYLHCAVLPSHLNYFVDEAEAALRPRPNRILCTGPAARDVLLALGRHDNVLPGMALRGPDPAALTMRQTRAPIRTILVLLEGLYKMVPLLRMLDQAAALAPHIRLVIRAHPMLPLATLADAAGVAAGPGTRLEPSTAASLEDAIAAADAVLYQGTTAALTAALMGAPLIRFDAQVAMTDDPLFRCAAFKREIREPADLASACAALDALTDAEWSAQRHQLRDYVSAYLRAPSAEALAEFCVAPISEPAAEYAQRG